MIIYRQKIFISQEYHDKIARRVGRRALFNTTKDAAIGGIKNVGIQTFDAAKHPIRTGKAVLSGVGNKISNSWQSLGNTFGIGKGSKDLTTSKRVRNIVHFASPTARRAMNIHDTASHVLGKNGNSWIDSMARFKATPISYMGQKTDTVARVGILGGASNLAGKVGLDKASGVLGKAQDITGGKWLGFNSDKVANIVGAKNGFNDTTTGAINLAGNITGYTTGERPGGLFEEIGKAATIGKEAQVAKEIADFKNSKQARRAAAYLNNNRAIKTANKIARADEKVVGKVAQGINTAGEKIGQGLGTAKGRIVTGTQTILSGLGNAFKKRPALTPIPVM